MTLELEQAARTCPHCGAACSVTAGARECPCCGQSYCAQGLVDHLPLADEDAFSFAPAALGGACAVALAIAAAVVLGPWALVAVVALAVLLVAGLALARRGQLDD